MDREEAARLHRDAHAKARKRAQRYRMTPLDGESDDPGPAPSADPSGDDMRFSHDAPAP